MLRLVPRILSLHSLVHRGANPERQVAQRTPQGGQTRLSTTSNALVMRRFAWRVPYRSLAPTSKPRCKPPTGSAEWRPDVKGGTANSLGLFRVHGDLSHAPRGPLSCAY
jgi:hypothetical protein